MKYHYLAFGIPVISEIKLPALLVTEDQSTSGNPILVKLGTVPTELSALGNYADKCAYCNANEMIYIIPEKIKFYITNGNRITIEPIDPDYQSNLIYFYSNCLAAALYQRDIVPFHVSGIFTETGKVALFAAPSGTGKSTLAVKLQEIGYQPFTDDTAVLFIDNEKCYAQASYPMIRLWENTLTEQTLLKEDDKQKIFDDGERDKYGFSFHNQFATHPVEVEQLIFLQASGDSMQHTAIKSLDAFKSLSDNVYRCHWIPFMQKSELQFKLMGQILNTIPYSLATRPETINSFSEFPLFIKKILQSASN